MILGSDGIKRMLKRHSESPSKLLGPKEQEIARRLAAGESRPSIARALKVSVHTVTATSRRIYAKLGIHSRAELAARML
jgi:DNA-binding NarL/FixJ family response regulator